MTAVLFLEENAIATEMERIDFSSSLPLLISTDVRIVKYNWIPSMILNRLKLDLILLFKRVSSPGIFPYS